MAVDGEATVASLEARIAQLEAENRRLSGATTPRAARGSWWRAVVSAICIVLASLLAAVAIVGAWVRVELVDPDRFVATFAPLVEDPAVQAAIVDGATTAILERVDVDGIVTNVFDGIATLDLPPKAVTALEALKGPAIQGAQAGIRQGVTAVVASDQFADVWSATLRASHRALVAAASGGSDSGAVTVNDQGVVGIQLAPIIAAVKERLVASGFGFASAIPEIDRTIVVAQSDALVTLRVVYNLAVAVGFWLPFVALALFGIGIGVARRRRTAIVGTGVGLALGAGGLAVALGIGATVVAASATSVGVSSAALGAVYEQVVADMRQTAVVLALVGVLVAILAGLLGPARPAVALRSAVAAGNGTVRRALRGHGLDTGRVGVWFDRQRILVRVLLVVLAIVWLLLLRPLSVGDVVLVTVVALIVWWLAEIVRRTPEDVSALPVDGDPARAGS